MPADVEAKTLPDDAPATVSDTPTAGEAASKAHADIAAVPGAITPPAGEVMPPDTAALSRRTPVLYGSMVPSAPSLTPADSLRQQSWGAKIYHGVLGALGGTQQTVMTGYDAKGNPIYSTADKGPGQQWKTIIAGALTGLAGGAGQRGPGAGMASFGAGFQAVQSRQDMMRKEQQQQAQQTFENQQKAAMTSAQTSLITTQTTALTFQLGRSQVEASVADVERENNYRALIAAGGDATRDLGHFADMDAVQEAFKKDPTLHDSHAQGQLVAIPHITDGKIDGVDAAFVTKDWLNAKITQDVTITYPKWEGGKLVDVPMTIRAGTYTNDQVMKLQMGQAADSVKTHLSDIEAQAKTTGAAAEMIKARSEAAKNYAEAKQLNEASDMGTIQNNAKMMVEGLLNPSNMNKRAKSYDATIQAANAYSMATYGRPFDVDKSVGDYKFATNVGTKNTLNYLNSLVGADNKGGNLQMLVDMSNKLDRSDFPALNDLQGWLSISEGHPEYLSLRTAALEVSDQVAKILQGGGTGSATSDKKLQQAQEMFDGKFSKEQIAGNAGTLQPLLANRKREMIGDNSYLLRWYGEPQTGPRGAGAPYATQPAFGGATVQSGGGAPVQLPDAAMTQLKQANGQPVRFTGKGVYQLNQAGQAIRISD